MKKPAGILALVENSMTSDRFSMTSDRFLDTQNEVNKGLAETIYCFIHSYPNDLSIRAFRSEAGELKNSSPGHPSIPSNLINPRETKDKNQSQEFNEGKSGAAARPCFRVSQALRSRQMVAGQGESKERKEAEGRRDDSRRLPWFALPHCMDDSRGAEFSPGRVLICQNG